MTVVPPALELPMAKEAATPTPTPPRLTLILFSLTTILLFADQNLMSPNLTAIADEFGLTDDERDRQLGGDISLAFFLLGAPASLVVGCLADSADRIALFAGTVAIGEGACLATYFVQNYPQLYICRAVTGFSVGGALPLIYSILGDLYVPKDRHVVSALVSFGTGAGISIGQAVAGFLGPTFGWRLPFLVIALPALVCAWAVWMFVPDPQRGAAELQWIAQGQQQQEQGQDIQNGDRLLLPQEDGGNDGGFALVPVSSFESMKRHASASSSSLELDGNLIQNSGRQIREEDRRDSLERYQDSTTTNTNESSSYHYHYYIQLYKSVMQTHLSNTRRLLSNPTLVLAIFQGAPGCIPWGIINTYLNDFLAQDRGLSVELATTTLMCFSIGHVFGLVLGGMGGSTLYQWDNRYPALLAGSMAILGCIPFLWLLNVVDADTPFWKVAGISILAGFGSGPTGPIIKATVTNVTHPTARGQAFALFNLFDDFGKGLGPFFVSLLIVQMGGRLPAFNVGVFGWVVCGLANLAIFGTVQKDEAVVMYSTIGMQSSEEDAL